MQLKLINDKYLQNITRIQRTTSDDHICARCEKPAMFEVKSVEKIAARRCSRCLVTDLEGDNIPQWVKLLKATEGV